MPVRGASSKFNGCQGNGFESRPRRLFFYCIDPEKLGTFTRKRRLEVPRLAGPTETKQINILMSGKSTFFGKPHSGKLQVVSSLPDASSLIPKIG